MTKANGIAGTTPRFLLTSALVLGASTIALAQYGQGGGREKDDHGAGVDKVLYIWAQDQAQAAPDFLAVIDFDEQSPKYGEVINVVPLPPDGGPAQGTMDVKMLPRDPHGYGYTSGMFDGHIYLIDPARGTGESVFDLSTVKPHVDTAVPGGMGQIMATPQSGDRLIVGTFMAGQVVMLDTTDRSKLKLLSVVSFGANAGPHNLVLSSDDNRLVVTDYFLNETPRVSSTLKATIKFTFSRSRTIPSPRTSGLN